MMFPFYRKPTGLMLTVLATVMTTMIGAQAQTRPPAVAQGTPAPAAPPAAVPTVPTVGNEPQSTTAAFGDWVLRCVRQTERPTPPRICEVAQTIQVQGQQGPLAQVAFGRVQRADPMKLTMVLPSNVSFPSVVRVSTDDKDPQPLDLNWRRCLPGACIADGEPSAAIIQRLRARAEPASISFKDAGGRDISVPFSLRGLSQALDALAKEAI